MALKKVKLDSYLKKFVDFCKQRYGKNLIAIGIYGSYAWGYFDKEKSDYDVFLIFKSSIKNETKMLTNRFKKIAVHYFCSSEDLLKLIQEGHWSPYITFLISAGMLYYSKDYEIFINKLRKIDFVKNLKDTERIEWKSKFNINIIKNSTGYKGAKYALPALRSRLQLLTYIKYKQLVWDLSKVIKLNEDILTDKEQKFLIQLDKSVRKRKNISYNKKMAINLSKKIDTRVISLLKSK